MKTQLTKQEKELLCQIVADRESGNHLLYPRSDEYKQMCKVIYDIVRKEEKDRTEREVEICCYLAACETPEANKLYEQIYSDN